jgi:hypothetical protein
MAKASIRDRIAKLENQRRFLDWFVMHRFWATLRLEELERFAAGGGLPDPVPNRPSNLDTVDQKSLIKLWEEEERVFRGRSQADQDSYASTGVWPGQSGRLHYSMQDGKLFVEWRSGPEEKDTESGCKCQEREDQSHCGGEDVPAKQM